MTTSADDRARRDSVIAACTRFAQGSTLVPVAQRLRALADAAVSDLPDLYGESGDLASLEGEVARLLGKPAAVFMPSGTMAQQCALRVWAGRTGRRAVAVHGLSHLVMHEEAALEVMHGIRLEQIGHDRRPLTVEDLTTAPGPYAALCVELPLRDAGYLLPPWEDLVELCGAARDRGIPVHLDGARLWESQPFYDRSHAEIAGVADTVYVSFYKGLGGIAGAALAGPQDVVDAARHWQHRHGGTLYSLFPFVVAAREGLARVADFGAYAVRARELAVALTRVPGVRVFPDPPHTNAFVLYADVAPDVLNETALARAESTHEWVIGRVVAADVPGWSMTELTVGPATMGWSVDELAEAISGLVSAARADGIRVAAHGSAGTG
jgi:threonine aldolase